MLFSRKGNLVIAAARAETGIANRRVLKTIAILCNDG
jgi:hypothetical protein